MISKIFTGGYLFEGSFPKCSGQTLLLGGHCRKVCASPVVALLPALLWKREEGENSGALFWQIPHHGQDASALLGLEYLYGLIPKGSCGVELEIFLMGSFPRKYHTELMLRDTLGFQGAAQ